MIGEAINLVYFFSANFEKTLSRLILIRGEMETEENKSRINAESLVNASCCVADAAELKVPREKGPVLGRS